MTKKVEPTCVVKDCTNTPVVRFTQITVLTHEVGLYFCNDCIANIDESRMEEAARQIVYWNESND